MISVAERVVSALLDATPQPPPVTTDASEVLAAAEAMTLARAELLDALAAEGVEQLDPSVVATGLAELHDREVRWGAALTRARYQLSERVASVARGHGLYTR